LRWSGHVEHIDDADWIKHGTLMNAEGLRQTVIMMTAFQTTSKFQLFQWYSNIALDVRVNDNITYSIGRFIY